MKNLKILLLASLLSASMWAQKADTNTEWNGYAQFRLFKYNNISEGFMIRRAKLWIKGDTPHVDNIYYKIMGIFTYNKSGFFGLLDAYGEYRFSNGYLRFGQQIPGFSLERDQPDWKIPLVERASVINRLIPAAQSLARDIGVQVHWQALPDFWQISAGIFNGDGANLKSHNSDNFLYDLRNSFQFTFSDNISWHLGFSAMYRYADQYDYWLIFGRNNLYTGDDFRFGFESLLQLRNLDFQAEYLQGDFGSDRAYGYYGFINYHLGQLDQAVLSVEQYVDLNPDTIDDAWLIGGYNHLFAEHDFKLMLSAGTQFNDNYSITTQIQLFFN